MSGINSTIKKNSTAEPQINQSQSQSQNQNQSKSQDTNIQKS